MIYEKIEEICIQKAITISAVEKEAGLGNGTIGKWKTCNPTVEKVKAVATVLNVPIAQLLE